MTFKMMILGRGSLQLVYALLTLLQIQASTGFNSSTGDDGVRCIESERQVLLAFKQGLDVAGGHGSLNFSWGSEEQKKNCCNWKGVQCSNTTGNIINLDLHGLGLRGGSFLNQIGNLTSLELLDLGDNEFGTVESLEWLSHLSSLKYLDLSNINLSTVASFQWMFNLSYNLVHLDLSETNLKGSVESLEWLSHLSSLKYLDLSNSNLSAVASFQWMFNLSHNLVYLNLSETSLKGFIPEALGNMASLEELHLQGNLFEGGIPKSFGNLCKLNSLHLSGNNLKGMLSEFIGHLSGCLESSLQILHLENNRIMGNIPDQIRNFSALKVLSLSNNTLNGTLTESIGLLSNLEELSIASNNFTGVITEVHFLNLSKLRKLAMSLNPLHMNFTLDWIPPFQLHYITLKSCKLGPDFPKWIQTQKNYSVLDISGNEISDSIPDWFWNFSSRNFTSSALYIDLSSNQIYGILPNLSTKITGFYDLKLDLSGNNLEGPLPSFPANATLIILSKNKFSGSILPLCSNRDFRLLDLSNNQLTGELPGCMMNWSYLTILNLANNYLFGKIPISGGSLYSLETFNLQNNTFSGEIPLFLRSCRNLQFLGLNDNRFSGMIPDWIGEIGSLNFLLLGSNYFYGNISLQLCWLTNIVLLDLSNNTLSGSIPWCIGNLTSLARDQSSLHDHFWDFSAILYDDTNCYGVDDKNGNFSFMLDGIRYCYKSYADKASVMWKGQHYDYENLKYLRVIDLSSNNLTAEIPVQISNLSEVQQLNLSRNHLNGSIPPDIGQMRQLESLDLSHNMLSGWLPSSMSQLNFLNTLDLSYNKFSGRIPSSTQLQSLPASAFVGNSALCGPPLTPTCIAPPPDGGGKGNQDEGDQFRKGFIPSMEIGMAIGFVGVLALKLDHPWKHVCFMFFNHVKVCLNNLKDWLWVIVAALCLVVTVNAARLRRMFKL